MIDLANARAEAGADDATDALAAIEDFAIDSHNSELQAVQLIGEVKTQAAELKAKRDAIVKPLRIATAEVDALFSPARKALEEIEAKLKARIVLWREGSEQRTLALLEGATTAATNDERAAVIQKADDTRPRDIDGLQIRETWTGDVTHPEEIPREYLIPDVKLLEVTTRTFDGDVDIPGWRPRKQRTIAISASKVSK